MSISYASDDSCSANGVVVDDVACPTRPGHDLLRGRRRHARRLDRAGPARRAARPTTTTGSPAPPRTRRRPGEIAPAPSRGAGDHRVPLGPLRPLPVLGRRRHRRRRPGSRLRAREPDPADLRAGLLRPTRERRRRRGPRARPPVVRRQPRVRRAGSTSGSTRASRPTPSGCGASARDSGPPRRSSTSSRPSPADDPFWTVTIGDPGPDQLFDDRRLLARRR